jgi:hypothetical protein
MHMHEVPLVVPFEAKVHTAARLRHLSRRKDDISMAAFSSLRPSHEYHTLHMAEAFGLAAGVLQVAGFGAELGSALWTCAWRMRYANKELKALAGQVDATARCLRSVDGLLDDSKTRAFHTLKLYKDTRAVSKGCDEVFLELDRAVRKSEDGGPKMSMMARLQWPLDSNKLAEPLKVLKNYNDVLHLMLAVLQIVEGRRAAYEPCHPSVDLEC